MIIAMIVATICINACSTDDEENVASSEKPPFTPTKRLIKVSDYNFTYDYIYDNQGRVTQINRNGQAIRTYSFDKNTITEIIYDIPIIPIWTNTYTLENGRIIRVYDDDSKTNTYFKYIDGYIVTEKEESGIETQYNWSEGNLMTIRGGAIETYEYSNYTSPQGFSPCIMMHIFANIGA